jgi:hypothetical protein
MARAHAAADSLTSGVIDRRPVTVHDRLRQSMRRRPARRQEISMSTYQELADRYIASWNEADPVARRRAIDELWAENARYVDPLAEAEGRDAIDATIAAVQGQFPGFTFRLVGAADGHHDQLRFTWELGPDGAEAPIVGFDVAIVDGDGRLETVLGFLDEVPA